MKKRILSLLLVMLMVVTLVPTAALAEDDVVTYKVIGGYIYFDKSTGTVTGTGSSSSITKAVIPAEIDGVAVTSIGDCAFYNCIGLTSVTIPDSVTSIGERAFYGCERLTSIEIPNSVTNIGNKAFSFCTGLTSIVIPNSVTWIGYNAFSLCTGLMSITIPNSVTHIGIYVFSGCTSLTSVTLSNSVGSIEGAFSGCTSLMSVMIPNSVTIINDAFSGCTSLTSVTIPNGVRFISGTFEGCTSLTSITIPNSVTSIGYSAFSGCTSLTSITIPNSVTYIGDYAFSGCTGLTSVIIPDSVTRIADRAFSGCTGLTSADIKASESIGSYAFKDCPNIETVNVESCSKIEGYAFQGCAKLKSLTLPTDLKTIGQFAFQGCTSLETLNIPSAETIDASAFSGCTALKSVSLPKNVKTIGSAAFFYCNNIKDVYYAGSETEWNAIDIGPDNEPITNATIHYAGETHTHDYKSTVTEPTCTEDGYTTYTCSCGKTYTADRVPAKGHSTELVGAKAATCTEDGYTGDEVCSVCSEIITKGENIAHFGHNYVNGKCVTCGAKEPGQTEEHVHNYSIIKVTEPTCTEQGYTTYTCSVCGKSYVSNYVSAMDHYYIDGACTRCGAEDPNYIQHTHVYNVHTEDPTCTKPGYTEHWCNICGKYYFDAVTNALGHNYVNGTCTRCGTSGTANVAESGFCGAGSGTNVYWTLYDDGTIVVSGTGDMGTISCDKSKIKKAIVEDGVISMNYAFQDCTNLKSASVPGSIWIMDYAFEGCTSLTDVTISEGVTRINCHAFEGCTSLKSITLPSTIDSVDEWSFAGCTALESITIPENVTLIMWNAFENCTSLKTVDIKSCNTINAYAFDGCTALESVNIPANIQYIDSFAFRGCTKLKTVNYEGTEAQWKNVNISDGNEPLKNAKLKAAGHEHSYGTPVVTKPTCTSAGYTTYTCTTCGQSYKDNYTDALGHDYKDGVCTRCDAKDPNQAHVHDYKSTVVKATCTEPGYTHYTCSCGSSYDDNYTDALGHRYLLGRCLRCGIKESEDEGLHIHSYKPTVIEPTCTEGGYTEWKCECGKSFEILHTKALGHEYKDGLCIRCGAKDPNAHTHKYVETVTKPTCTEKGCTTYTCSICGDSYKDNYVNALGHNYVNGACTRCGAKDPNYKPAVSFIDVPSDAFYAKSVKWAVENGITEGVGNNRFDPNGQCTRGQVVTFLWRAAGKPTVSANVSFSDVQPGAFYYEAVKWAVANGITTGVGGNRFAPNDSCTRGQVVTFLHRAANSPAASTISSFTDVPATAFYYNAVNWAVANGITDGVGNNRFAPNDTCTRAQVVTFLYRAQ